MNALDASNSNSSEVKASSILTMQLDADQLSLHANLPLSECSWMCRYLILIPNPLLTLTIPHVNETPGLPRQALCVRKISRQFMIVVRHLPARLTAESQTIYN